MNSCETRNIRGIIRDVPIYTLLETAGIGGAHALQAILSERSETGKALRHLGVNGFSLAGSITGMPGNALCDARFGTFSAAIQSLLDNQVKHSAYNWRDHQKISGFDDPNPLHQLIDFLTGRNADVVIYTDNKNLSLSAIYEVLKERLSLDLPEGSPLIISRALHASRLEVIQLRDPRDKDNQGINITLANEDDTWNNRCSSRKSEVVPVLHNQGYPYIEVGLGGWRVPNQLLITPADFPTWHTIFAQELRRTAMQPDRGMAVDSFTAKLRVIHPDAESNYLHEQICLITANLTRALDRYPEEVTGLIASIPELKPHFALKSNTDRRTAEVMMEYATTTFENPRCISPYLIHLLSIALPVNLDIFLGVNQVATHTVLQSSYLR